MTQFLFRGVALVSVEAIGEGETEALAKADATTKMRKAVEASVGKGVLVTSVTNKSLVPKSDGTNGPIKTLTDGGLG